MYFAIIAWSGRCWRTKKLYTRSKEPLEKNSESADWFRWKLQRGLYRFASSSISCDTSIPQTFAKRFSKRRKNLPAPHPNSRAESKAFGNLSSDMAENN